MTIDGIGGKCVIGLKLVEKLRRPADDALAASPDTGDDTYTGKRLQPKARVAPFGATPRWRALPSVVHGWRKGPHHPARASALHARAHGTTSDALGPRRFSCTARLAASGEVDLLQKRRRSQ
jgi:hypothetical protein